MSHTPGPWSVCTEPANASWHKGLTIGSDSTGTRVADTFWAAYHGEKGVAANARLIAAAPELLAAAQEILEANESGNVIARVRGFQSLSAAVLKACSHVPQDGE